MKIDFSDCKSSVLNNDTEKFDFAATGQCSFAVEQCLTAAVLEMDQLCAP